METYEKYKPSGIDWIGEVPEHWEVMQLRRFAKVFTGSTPPTSRSDFYDSEDVLWYTPSDFTYDTYRLGESEKKISNLAVKEYVGELFPKNSILMTGIGLVGKLGITPEDCYSNQQINAILVDKSQSVEFVAYYLKGIKDIILSLPKASLLPILNQSETKQIAVVLPPLSEQEAIAAYLDARCADIDKVVATQQKRIALLQELKQSEITKAVTRGLNPDARMKDSGVEWIGMVPEHWEVCKVKHCCKDEKYAIKTGPFGTQLKGEDLKEEGPVCVYNQRNVIDDDFSSTNYFVSEEKANQLSSFYTKENDLLITSRGTIGRCAILPKDVPMGVLHPCLIAVRVNENRCLLQWLKFFINETNCFSTCVKLNSNATTIDVIYTDTLKNVTIPLPSIREQENILTYLDRRCGEIDKQIGAVTKQIELLREYKQALITEVVTGKRKV